ncbi:EpsG family protein [Bacillus mycoides]|uniref:EpsG family protein n=1 Tax=Bacillus TaxID=1386 RepID=UPI000992299A|nr:EpsG family protein [Bacillus mycoides]MED0941471.1 EpsG family protein [Bacillus mycoides]MED1009861.1 EpsG family protein [Bacillus mycoides]MED1022197.1 EpsG family protein [Bacillus mycoides]MED1041894.1 EpsG family protein [Bacillus mycoides]MED1047428.1 EpsG family protein [Bacillus mycoides]
MFIFWVTLALVYILSFLARYFSTPVIMGPHIVQSKPNKLLVFLTIVILVMVSGLRNNIGDTFFYMYSYKKDTFDWEHIKEGKDMGFNVLQMILKQFSNDPQILIFVTALITNVLIVLVLYKYTRMFELSLYVYITGGMYLISMNGIRQFLAAAIIFAATKYIFEGNWKKYILIILFASTIHQTALILIPIYFMIRRKAWSWETYVTLFCSVFIVIGFNQFLDTLFSVIGDSQYGDYKNFSEGGANILRVGVNIPPIIIAYIGREKLREIFPKSDYVVNMSILGLVFMIISTQNWIFARFSIYFGLYQLILISWIIKLFTDKDQKLVYYAILIFYFIFYAYENVLTLNIIYKSNFLNF